MSPSLRHYVAHTTCTSSYKTSQNSCFHRFTYPESSESSSIPEKFSINGFPGLQDRIKLVPIDLQNRPDWYKEKVYPTYKVSSLEDNNKATGESLDLVKYVDSNVEGPSLLPDDPEKQKFAEELIAYSDIIFVPIVYRSFANDAQTLAGGI
ncbi:hypothetical protein MTR67_023464 [Solanum verrucosum]|uniref:GST N-terminal domain-containing protein n=1 Tax=Solanum verrucosum TaxID=315347 RepID=A0AAF0R1X1_SOLVR|nr:hypothetical protein MTR67_023464 [Solanum verrucosum]